MGIFSFFSKDKKDKLDKGLEKTKENVFGKLSRAVAGKSKVDEDALDDIEEALITSDIGVETTLKIIERLEERVAKDKYLDTNELNAFLKEEMSLLLEESNNTDEVEFVVPQTDGPYVIMVVGVNGVGKTTTVINLAAGLSLLGKKVLVIDLDPQGNATTGLGLSNLENSEKSIYSVLNGNKKISDVIQKTEFENLDIITSNVDLSGLEVETAGDSRRAFKLKDELASILNDSRASYHYILIDCPPSLSLLTIMALVASDALVVPLQTEFFALEGLTQLMKTIERIKSNLNPILEIRGILLTMYDKRNKLSSQVEMEARNFFKEKVYNTAVPRNVRLSEAPSHGVPVLIYDKLCPGSKAYFSFTEEFLEQEKEIETAA